jgi:2-dehydro-3-deoxygluconokinase
MARNKIRKRNAMSTDIVSFGETMLRLTTEAGLRLEDTRTLHIYVGGTESNTLACTARLGLNATWLSALPDNPPGRLVASELRRHGIDVSHIVWDKPTARLGIFYVEEAREPLGIQVYYDRANSACALVDPDAIDLSVVDTARILHLTGITPALGPQTREVCKLLLERARTHQVPISFDVNYRAKLWSASEAASAIEEACQQANILICALGDATELWGFRGEPEEILRQMARRFSRHDIPKAFVLTLGSAGSAQLRDGIYTTEPAIPTQGSVRFGSGDAFAAGYLYAYLDGPLFQTMKKWQITPLAFGNALASLKRSIKGDIATITPEEVRAILIKQEGRRFR